MTEVNREKTLRKKEKVLIPENADERTSESGRRSGKDVSQTPSGRSVFGLQNLRWLEMAKSERVSETLDKSLITLISCCVIWGSIS